MPESHDDRRSSTMPTRRREYNAASSSRHRKGSMARRLFFFSLASVWGFVVGVAGLLAAFSASGQPVHPGDGVVSRLVPALVAALAGGFVVAFAYRESKRRSRSAR